MRVVLVLSALICVTLATYEQTSAPINVFLVPHSHWDVGWLSTPQEYYDFQVRSILNNVMRAMKDNSARKFVFSEIAYMQKWWDKDATTAQKMDFRIYLEAGRFEFVQGAYTMPDEALNTYNAIIQTISRGHEWIRDTFGTKYLPNTSWRIDSAGATTTITKLYKESGYKNTVISRIPRTRNTYLRQKKQLEFLWSTTSGKTFTHVIDKSYCEAMFFEDQYWITDNFIRTFGERYQGYATGNLLLPFGCDFSWLPMDNTWSRLDVVLDQLQHDQKYNRTYNVHFATVSEYMKTVTRHEEENERNFVTLKDELLPYNDADQSWWTGYYSSYPTLKSEARRAESLLNVCNQIYTLHGEEDTTMYRALEHLRRAVSEVSTHEGITGTAKRYVVNYFIQELQETSRYCLAQMGIALARSTNTSLSFASRIESSEFTPVVVYNNLAWRRAGLVSVDVQTNQSFCIYDTDGNKVPSQTVADKLLFTPRNVPVLGYSTYFASPCSPVPDTEVKTSNFSIGNSHISLKFCMQEEGLVPCAYVTDGMETPIEIKYLAYYGVVGGWGTGQQGSGAYIFNPQYVESSSNFTGKYDRVTNATVHNGPCTTVEQSMSPYIKHSFTICEDDEAVRYSITGGGATIPQGLEIVTRISTPIKNNRTIYCDKNGLETRRYEHRVDVEPETARVAANILPMVQSCFIRDDTDLQLTVLTNQAQGTSSQKEGSIEVMVYRTTQRDDSRGLDEPLQDSSEYTVSMMIYLEKKAYEYNEEEVVYPIESLEHNHPMVVAVSTPIVRIEDYTGVTSFGADLETENVHLLSLDTISDRNGRNFDYTVIRLHNMDTSDKVLSMTEFLEKNDLLLIAETTLAASRRTGDPPQQIILNPNQIRTFIAVKKHHLVAYTEAQKIIQNDEPTVAPTAAPTTTQPVLTTETPTQEPKVAVEYSILWFLAVVLALVVLSVNIAQACQ